MVEEVMDLDYSNSLFIGVIEAGLLALAATVPLLF